MNARLPGAVWPQGVRRHGSYTPASGEASMAFTLDGQPAPAREGESILLAARRHGVAILHLCHSDGLRPDDNGRSCVVEVAGERVLAASCSRAVTPGMDVKAQSERAIKSQRLVLELLAANLPHPKQAGELSDWLQRAGVTVRRTGARPNRLVAPSRPGRARCTCRGTLARGLAVGQRGAHCPPGRRRHAA